MICLNSPKCKLDFDLPAHWGTICNRKC